MIEYIETASEQDPDGPSISVNHLREHARAAGRSWGVTRQVHGKGEFQTRVEAAKLSLAKLYAELDRMPPPDYSKISGPDPILTLRENPRLLRAALLQTASLRRQIPRLPRIVVARSAWMTSSATSPGTSTSEKPSAISIAPISLESMPASLAIAPTRSPGRTPALRPNDT